MLKSLPTFCLLAISAVLLHTQPASAQALDPAFAPTTILYGNGFSVRAMLLQPDGKVVVGGSDDFLNGVLTSKLRRLNADGSPDAAFLAQTGTGPDIGTVQALALQADGKIMASVQSMTSYSGVPASGIVRLNADGSVDAAFNAGGLGSTQPNASFNGNIRSLAVQADGKILVGTWPVSIPSYYNGQAVGSLLRLNTDGSLDTSFNLGSGLTRVSAEPAVEAIVVQADGKILVGGRFDALNGTAAGNLVRLNANGSIDASFAIGSGIGQVSNGVRALAQQADGKLLVGGGFGTFAGAPNANLIRLNLNGTLDNTFQGPTDSPLVLHLRPQANGSILLAGNFRRYNGAVVGGVARLSSTGTLDASFVSGAGITTSYTYDFLPIANGQYLVGGGFTDYSGTPRTGLARLTSTAALDPTYNPVYGYKGSISAVGALPNGQLLVQGSFDSFNGTAAASGYGTPHLINANGTYNGPVPGTSTGTVLLLPNGQLYRLTPSPTGTVTTVTRLLTNGTTDAGFAPTTVSNNPDLVNLVLNSTATGGLFLLGNFVRVNGTARTGVARLLPDGTLDAGFAPAQPWGTTPNTLPDPTAASLPNNQALIGWTDTQSHLVRLTATGAPDPAFSIGTAAGTAGTFTTVPQPDGRLLVTGYFTSFNGQAAPGLLRLLPTGAPDASFVPALSLDRLVVQPDGRILGTQNAHRPTNQLRRLNADGSLDASFAAVPIPEPPYSRTGLLGYLLQPADGKILLYGDFTTVNGQPRTGLARLGNTLLATRPAFAAAPELDVFPNPAQQQVTLRVPATAVSATAQPVLLLDLQGRTVRRFTLPARQVEATISLADVAAGVYLLQATTGQGPVRQRVAVAR